LENIEVEFDTWRTDFKKIAVKLPGCLSKQVKDFEDQVQKILEWEHSSQNSHPEFTTPNFETIRDERANIALAEKNIKMLEFFVDQPLEYCQGFIRENFNLAWQDLPNPFDQICRLDFPQFPKFSQGLSEMLDTDDHYNKSGLTERKVFKPVLQNAQIQIPVPLPEPKPHFNIGALNSQFFVSFNDDQYNVLDTPKQKDFFQDPNDTTNRKPSLARVRRVGAKAEDTDSLMEEITDEVYGLDELNCFQVRKSGHGSKLLKFDCGGRSDTAYTHKKISNLAGFYGGGGTAGENKENFDGQCESDLVPKFCEDRVAKKGHCELYQTFQPAIVYPLRYGYVNESLESPQKKKSQKSTPRVGSESTKFSPANYPKTQTNDLNMSCDYFGWQKMLSEKNKRNPTDQTSTNGSCTGKSPNHKIALCSPIQFGLPQTNQNTLKKSELIVSCQKTIQEKPRPQKPNKSNTPRCNPDRNLNKSIENAPLRNFDGRKSCDTWKSFNGPQKSGSKDVGGLTLSGKISVGQEAISLIDKGANSKAHAFMKIKEKFPNNLLTNLNLQDQNIDCSLLGCLMVWLRTKRKMKTLNLTGNRIKDVGLSILCECLIKLPIEKLILDQNLISIDGLGYLLEFVKVHRRISEVSLRYNRLESGQENLVYDFQKGMRDFVELTM
jgi:hypothetical protein